MSKSTTSKMKSGEISQQNIVPVATHVTKSSNTGGKVANDIRRGASMLQWMWIFRIFILIGVTIFTIGQIAGLPDGNLAAYIWFAVGLLASWILAMRLVATNKQSDETFSGTLNSISVMLPNLGTLIPLSILIFITVKIRPILEAHPDSLPSKFYWFNRFSFFLIVMQLFILHKFYISQSTDSGNAAAWRGVWVGAIILFSVLTSAAAIELFVIVTSFITDG